MKLIKKVILLLLFSILIFVSVSNASDFIPPERTLSRLEDDARLLTDEEVTALRKKLDAISEELGVDVVIHTNYSLNDKFTRDYADDYFDYNGFGMGKDYEGILFVLSMEYRDWVISTHGPETIRAFSDKGQEYIMDKILGDLSNGDYYTAFDKFADYSKEYILQARKGEPYDYGNMPKNKRTPQAVAAMAGGSGLIGTIAGAGYTGVLAQTHKTKKRRKTAGGYQEGIINFRNKQDNYITRNVTRQRIPKQQNFKGGGGGGSSTWTSSSGRSHGGSSGKF